MGNAVLQKSINKSLFKTLAVIYIAFRNVQYLNRSRRISKQPLVCAKVWPVSVTAQKLMKTLFLCHLFFLRTILLMHTYIIATFKIYR